MLALAAQKQLRGLKPGKIRLTGASWGRTPCAVLAWVLGVNSDLRVKVRSEKIALSLPVTPGRGGQR